MSHSYDVTWVYYNAVWWSCCGQNKIITKPPPIYSFTKLRLSEYEFFFQIKTFFLYILCISQTHKTNFSIHREEVTHVSWRSTALLKDWILMSHVCHKIRLKVGSVLNLNHIFKITDIIAVSRRHWKRDIKKAFNKTRIRHFGWIISQPSLLCYPLKNYRRNVDT